MKDNKLELLVNVDDFKYINDNNTLIIDELEYNYKISKISEEIYKDENYNNYKYVYLDVNNITNVDNYTYKIKIKKDYKTLAFYLKNLIIEEE